MRISRRLGFLSALPIALLIIISAATYVTYQDTRESRAARRVASGIETQVFSLSLLAYDFLLYPEERGRQRWQDLHAELGTALSRAGDYALDVETLRRLRADHRELAVAFSKLRKDEQTTDRAARERESWQQARLLLHTQTAFTDAVGLRELAEARVLEEQARFLLFTFVLLSAVGLASAAIAWRISTGIRHSLRRLREAATAISAGNLDYRLEMDPAFADEHAELARAMNSMATHLKRLQQQLIRAEKRAALGTLAGGVAHELNNPLMGIMGYVNRAQQQTSESDTRVLLIRAEQQLLRVRDLLANMTRFAQPLDEKLTDVRIAETLERTLQLVRADLRANGVELVERIPSTLPPVRAAAVALQQVFLNLLSNARDAVEGRPVRRIEVEATADDRGLSVSIRDTGPGIPARIADRIFDPFFTTKPPGKGTGLGLTVSRSLITDMGGSLECESTESQGAVFTIIFPRDNTHGA